MSIKIDTLKKEELPLYKALIDECFGGSEDIEKYRDYSENKGYTIYTAKDGNDIVGSVTTYKIELFTFDFQPCLMLFNVAVKADRRREKIAAQMLEYIIKQAKAEGCRSISLTCLEDAAPARCLYESVGFKKCDSVKYSLELGDL